MNDQKLQELIDNYLSLTIGHQKLNILKTALKRLKLTYKHLFYSEEDFKIYLNIKVYDHLDSLLDEMGDDIFSLKEKAIIEEAKEVLNRAPDEVKWELEYRYYC
jgi:predicted nuclease with TOPRIM domain